MTKGPLCFRQSGPFFCIFGNAKKEDHPQGVIFLKIQSSKSALGRRAAARCVGGQPRLRRGSWAGDELRSTTGGLQTVLLLLANPKTLDTQGFSASLSEFNPYFNPLQTQSNLVRLVDRTLCSQQPKAVRVYYT